MTRLTDILSGFDVVRAAGAAYVVDVAETTRFELFDVERVVALHGSSPTNVTPMVGDVSDVPARTRCLVWRRNDGTFGAIASVSIDNRDVTIEWNAGSLRLVVAGATRATVASAAFAVAADPYVAADFCRLAATQGVGGEGAEMAPADSRASGETAEEAVWRDAVVALWLNPTAPTPAPRSEAAVDLDAVARAIRVGSRAMITRDRLFVDCPREPRLLKVFTHKGRDGVLGLFNCHRASHGDMTITDSWRVDDIENLGGEQFAAWHAVERKLFIINRGVDEAITLPPLGAELIHLVPILQNVAPLGLIDKLNASGAMTRVGSRKCKLSDGGTVGWYVAKRPAQVLLDGEPVAFEYDQASGLLTFRAADGRPHDSEVTL